MPTKVFISDDNDIPLFFSSCRFRYLYALCVRDTKTWGDLKQEIIWRKPIISFEQITNNETAVEYPTSRCLSDLQGFLFCGYCLHRLRETLRMQKLRLHDGF
mmetsp:Transcript_43622/g.85599  ORF Transcript_43622/g.85599 Transcript_43622/m.85599 type:complete len:102 (-) Transcript_43622:616-921(-)